MRCSAGLAAVVGLTLLLASGLSCSSESAAPCVRSERIARTDTHRVQITSSTCEFSEDDLDVLPMIEARGDEAWPDHVVAVFRGKSDTCFDFRGVADATASRVTVHVEGDWRPDGECSPDDFMSLDYGYGVYEIVVPLGEPLGDRPVLMSRTG